jgi:hypothetical protein
MCILLEKNPYYILKMGYPLWKKTLDSIDVGPILPNHSREQQTGVHSRERKSPLKHLLALPKEARLLLDVPQR